MKIVFDAFNIDNDKQRLCTIYPEDIKTISSSDEGVVVSFHNGDNDFICDYLKGRAE